MAAEGGCDGLEVAFRDEPQPCIEINRFGAYKRRILAQAQSRRRRGIPCVVIFRYFVPEFVEGCQARYEQRGLADPRGIQFNLRSVKTNSGQIVAEDFRGLLKSLAGGRERCIEFLSHANRLGALSRK